MPDFIPQAASAYIKNKKLTPAFSYKDVWKEEHAASFTVAKAMQLDVLADLHNATISAIENGQSFDTFKKNIKPTLQQKGWWGKKDMTDPLTGKIVNAQLGSDRRLKTIYRVNMRSAYQKGQYERTMESDLHPYLMYRIGPSVNHREEHLSWNGLILPKTDPWWDSHFPPNGWGCKCYTRAVTEARLKKYQSEGIPNAGGGNIKPKTDAPPVTYKTYINERKGITEKVPEGVDPAFNWNVGKAGFKNAAAQKLAESKKNYEAAVAAKPKKEYATKKKLQADIAAIEAQIKTAKTKKAAAALEAKKADAQKILDTKTAAQELKKLTKQSAVLQKQVDAIQIKTYSGIWKEEITTADWGAKSAGLEAKKAYYKNKLAAPGITAADVAKYEQYLKAIDEFDLEGKHYYAVSTQLAQVKNRLTELKKGGIVKTEASNAITQARKDAGLWAKTQQEYDDVVRGSLGKVWKRASAAEKKAAWAYTDGSGKFNRPLRGYEGTWSNFKGVGKVDLNAELNFEGAKDKIKELENLIDKSSYDVDIWLRRGTDMQGAAAFFKMSESELRNMPMHEMISKVKDKFFDDESFVSCGSSQNTGFGGNASFRIFCPKGTKMIYAEPFSQFNGDNKPLFAWDGVSKQKNFGGEFETIIQRGTKFKVTKVEKLGYSWNFEMEVVEQPSGGK